MLVNSTHRSILFFFLLLLQIINKNFDYNKSNKISNFFSLDNALQISTHRATYSLWVQGL